MASLLKGSPNSWFKITSIKVVIPFFWSSQDCFMGTNLDILVIEDFILFKEDQDKSLLKDYKNKFELD